MNERIQNACEVALGNATTREVREMILRETFGLSGEVQLLDEYGLVLPEQVRLRREWRLQDLLDPDNQAVTL